VPQHARDIVEHRHRPPGGATAGQGDGKNPEALGTDRHREIDHHRGPGHATVRSPNRSSITGTIHNNGHPALVVGFVTLIYGIVTSRSRARA
jgi:hypothetical protein